MPPGAKEDSVRRTRLCQVINPEVLVVGIDVAKSKHVAVAFAGDGRASKPKSFDATRSGFEALLAFARDCVTRMGAKGFVVGLEPTGHYAHTLVTWLLGQKIDVFSVQPSHTNKAKVLLDGTTRKTDPKDAEVIASLCRQGFARAYRVPVGAFATLRVLSHQRQQLVKRRSQVVNRMHRHVDVMFPELRSLFPKLESTTCLWVLRTVPTPADVLAMPLEELAEALYVASRWQLGEERAREMREAAEASVGITEGLAGHRLALEQLLGELEAVLAQIAAVEKQMAVELGQVPYAALLRSVPRLGMVTTATLLGEFGDLRNFKVAKQLIAMAGLSLVEKSSGQHHGHQHISRRGRAYARQMLYLAALRVGWGFLAEPRRRKVEDRKGEKTHAAVANMARLLRVMHAIVRDNKPFDATRFTPRAEPKAA
jgi:transposase